jgi:hypothetical protein
VGGVVVPGVVVPGVVVPVVVVPGVVVPGVVVLGVVPGVVVLTVVDVVGVEAVVALQRVVRVQRVVGADRAARPGPVTEVAQGDPLRQQFHRLVFEHGLSSRDRYRVGTAVGRTLRPDTTRRSMGNPGLRGHQRPIRI